VSTRTPKNKCLKCGYVTDAASHMRDEGDISLCMKCGELHVFTKALTYKELSPRKLLELKASVKWLEVIKLRRALKEVQKSHPIPDR
jgi:NAD-dependent SIR2 family protein deacetylase